MSISPAAKKSHAKTGYIMDAARPRPRAEVQLAAPFFHTSPITTAIAAKTRE
jgi:hypothetical protein